MKNLIVSKMVALKIVLWAILFFSTVSILGHIRWYYMFYIDPISYKPFGIAVSMPDVWFIGKILSSIVFLIVGILLKKLLKKYEKTHFFGIENIKIFDFLIYACLFLVFLAAFQLAVDSYFQLIKPRIFDGHYQISSLFIFLNGIIAFVFKLFISDGPATMYLLLAMVLWAVKQFVAKALEIKSENESFI